MTSSPITGIANKHMKVGQDYIAYLKNNPENKTDLGDVIGNLYRFISPVVVTANMLLQIGIFVLLMKFLRV